MNIEIKYKSNPSDENPCFAFASIGDGEVVCGIGKTWEEAKSDAIDSISRYLAGRDKVPPPETVEIGL